MESIRFFVFFVAHVKSPKHPIFNKIGGLLSLLDRRAKSCPGFMWPYHIFVLFIHCMYIYIHMYIYVHNSYYVRYTIIWYKIVYIYIYIIFIWYIYIYKYIYTYRLLVPIPTKHLTWNFWGQKGLKKTPLQSAFLLVSKKSPTGPTERTPQPEYLIALATYLGVRW